MKFVSRFSSAISINLIVTCGKVRKRRIVLEVRLLGKLLPLEKQWGIASLIRLWEFIVTERILHQDLPVLFRPIRKIFSTSLTPLNLSKLPSSWDKVPQHLMPLKK